jgi:hypothetical protein
MDRLAAIGYTLSRAFSPFRRKAGRAMRPRIGWLPLFCLALLGGAQAPAGSLPEAEQKAAPAGKAARIAQCPLWVPADSIHSLVLSAEAC